MRVELELWHMLVMAGGVIGSFAGLGKLLLSQFDKRMDVRFVTQEQAAKGLHESIREQQMEMRQAMANIQKAEREMLEWRAELPNLYVRRDDYIRNQTIIQAKLESIIDKIQLIDMKVAQK
jgi:hypothetical protein